MRLLSPRRWGHFTLVPLLMVVAWLSASRLADAGPITATEHFGVYSGSVNGVVMIRGSIGALDTGELYLAGGPVPLVLLTPDRLARLTFTSISGNADPAITFGVTAANLSDASMAFLFDFEIPIALTGPIFAHSGLSYTLFTTTTATASITPTLATLLTAVDKDYAAGGLGELNKGLDVGAGLSVAGPGSASSGLAIATSLFTGDLAYDTMIARLGFTLTPHTTATFGGLLEQTMDVTTSVPEPASLTLLALGLGGAAGRGLMKRVRSR